METLTGLGDPAEFIADDPAYGISILTFRKIGFHNIVHTGNGSSGLHDNGTVGHQLGFLLFLFGGVIFILNIADDLFNNIFNGYAVF